MIKQLTIVFTVLSLLIFHSVSGWADTATPPPLSLVYSGNLNGELEPCGCAEESDLGGIKRRATMIQRLRKENPDMFLISTGGLLSSESPRDRLKGEYILKGMEMLNYDAIGIQWRDLSYGSKFVEEASLPWVASNWKKGGFQSIREIRHGSYQLAFFSWLDPRKSPQVQMHASKEEVSSNSKDLALSISKAKHQNAITVLATTLPEAQAQSLLPLDNVDILIIRAENETYGEPKFIGKTLVIKPGTRGMRLGKLDFNVDDKNRIHSFKHSVISLPKTVPDAEQFAAWYDEYNAKVKEDYLKRVELRKKMNAGDSPYIGEEACESCHPKEYKIWQNSKHAQAYSALEAVNKAFDPDCIMCHTVGFEKPGGFIDSTITSHLLNVQCESCHGPSRSHVESGGAKQVANAAWPKEQICNQCHVGSHSPSFQFDRYWPKIAHSKKATSAKKDN